MARKPVLAGGKKDEIIDAALRLFIANGYDNTSVRLILDAVGGEIGMFYHYFTSKDEVFKAAADRFLQQYIVGFNDIAGNSEQPLDQQLRALFRWFTLALDQYQVLAKTTDHSLLKFPQREALHSRTLDALTPPVEQLLNKAASANEIIIPTGVTQKALAQFILHGIAGVLDLVNTEGALSAVEKHERYTQIIMLLAVTLQLPADRLKGMFKPEGL